MMYASATGLELLKIQTTLSGECLLSENRSIFWHLLLLPSRTTAIQRVIHRARWFYAHESLYRTVNKTEINYS